MSTPRAIRTLSRSTLASVSKPITPRAIPALGPSFTGGLYPPATRHFATGSIRRKDIKGHIVPDVTKENEATVSGLSKVEEADEAPLARHSGPSLFSLSDRTIIVTGGARGLGLTIAHALVQSGADVHCLDILPEPVEPQWSEVKSEAESLGSKISYGQLNVTSPDDVYSTIGSIFQNARSTHPVRGLYHAAGINLLAPVEDIDIESFRRVIDINLVGSHLVSQAFAKEYFKRHEDAPPTSTLDTGVTKAGEGASIVLTASMSGTVANFGLDNAVYNSSKAGVIQLARNYAYEWSKRGIRVNTLSPGYIRTAMTQALFDQQPHLPELFLRTSLLGRMSTPDEFRGPVIYLLSDASSFMTGADILVDGGHTAV